MELKEQVREQIAEMLELETDELGFDDLLVEDHGMDSFSAMQLVVTLESEYDIKIPGERIAELKSVNEIIKVIEELK